MDLLTFILAIIGAVILVLVTIALTIYGMCFWFFNAIKTIDGGGTK